MPPEFLDFSRITLPIIIIIKITILIIIITMIFFNWDSLHARLRSHYEAWHYKKRSTKRITGYRKSVLKEPVVKRCLLILDLKPLNS